MIIQYRPEEGEPQDFDASRLRASEIQVIERTADGRWAELKRDLSNGDINAMRVVAFVIQKRTNPSLRLVEFDPWEGELRVRLDQREVRGYAEGILEKFRGTPELGEAFDELRESAADVEACERIIADVTAPKAPAPEPELNEAEPENSASPSDA